MLFENRFGKFNSRLVKLLRKMIVNLQSGNEYLLQIRDCKIPKENKNKKTKKKCNKQELYWNQRKYAADATGHKMKG